MKGSCAFEHVFLGEVKRGVVKGFHNWLFFLMQEQKGEVRKPCRLSEFHSPNIWLFLIVNLMSMYSVVSEYV